MSGVKGGRDGKRAKPGMTLRERVELHTVRSETGCLLWTGCVDNKGYGRIQVGKRTGYAHRVYYEVMVGPIEPGKELDHLCRVPTCIDPLHLEAVTPSVNVRRGESPGAKALRRDLCLYGHPYDQFGVINSGRRVCSECNRVYSRLHKLVPYAEAMRRKRAGEPVVDLAAHFGVSQEVAS